MKNLIRKLIPVVLLVAAILPASSVHAAGVNWYQEFNGNANGVEVLRNSPPSNLLIREETPVYANPGDAKAIGALAPQILHYIEAYEDTANINKWYYIDTWLGKAWVHPNRPIAGYVNVEGKGETISVIDWSTVPYLNTSRNNKTLYADAFQDTAITWASLAPQKHVEVVAKGNGMYQVKTWIGIYWVGMTPPPPRV
jgi:hypothetical protein